MAHSDTSTNSSDATSARLREQEIQVAKFSLLCGNLGWILVGTTLTGLALFVAVKDQLPLDQRLLWVTLLLLITSVRAVLLRHWLRVPTTAENVNRRILVATMMSTLLGIGFGLFGYLVVSENGPLSNLLIVMVLTSMVATASAAISHLLPMFLLYVFPLMLPVVYRLTQLEQSGYHWIAGLIVLYLIVCLGTSRNIRASIMQSINIRFDNQNLMSNLREEKQRAEIALKREEQANHAKSKFLAAASHDLRQPLHSLRLFTATLELQTRDTKHKTLVSQIDSSVKSLEELFNALLDISKLDAGTFSVDKRHVHMNTLLSQIEGEFKPLAKEKQLHFNVELSDHVIFTDPLLLERLLRNLCSNAIRYTTRGVVDLRTEVEGERVLISVSDTGVGMPEADHARVFDEFVQLGNVERDRNQGIGLGLSIVKRLSTLLGVEVEVQSQPGKGSTFTVGVSLGDPAQCEYLPRYPADDGESVESLFVLVIDDEEEVCLAIEGLLETWGCIVMTATSGDAALQQLEEIGEVPDVLVSDYRLRQGETGGDAIRRVRAHLRRDIPAIILTGDIAPDRLQDIKSLGFPMLHKPCEPEELRHLLANVAKTSQASGLDDTVDLVSEATDVRQLRVVER